MRGLGVPREQLSWTSDLWKDLDPLEGAGVICTLLLGYLRGRRSFITFPHQGVSLSQKQRQVSVFAKRLMMCVTTVISQQPCAWCRLLLLSWGRTSVFYLSISSIMDCQVVTMFKGIPPLMVRAALRHRLPLYL